MNRIVAGFNAKAREAIAIARNTSKIAPPMLVDVADWW